MGGAGVLVAVRSPVKTVRLHGGWDDHDGGCRIPLLALTLRFDTAYYWGQGILVVVFSIWPELRAVGLEGPDRRSARTSL